LASRVSTGCGVSSAGPHSTDTAISSTELSASGSSLARRSTWSRSRPFVTHRW
jgi:hypothetical protein